MIGIENRLSTAFEHNVKLRGAQSVAFPTQVAGGNNSQYVQYACNDCIINPGDVGDEHSSYHSSYHSHFHSS